MANPQQTVFIANTALALTDRLDQLAEQPVYIDFRADSETLIAVVACDIDECPWIVAGLTKTGYPVTSQRDITQGDGARMSEIVLNYPL